MGLFANKLVSVSKPLIIIANGFLWRVHQRSVFRFNSAEGLLVPAVHCVGSGPWRLVGMDSGRVSTFSFFKHLETPCAGYGSWNLCSHLLHSGERPCSWYRACTCSCKPRGRLRGGTIQFDNGALLFYFSEIEAKYVLPFGMGFFFDYFPMLVVTRYVDAGGRGTS